MRSATTRVLVSVGTDHHPFERLMDWLQQWLPTRPDVELWVQHGPAHAVLGAAQNVDRLPKVTLLSWIDGADIVLLQGGPGGIVDALRAGHRPLVVPRVAALREVVDDHQVAFCLELDRRGLVSAAQSYTQLAALLDNPPHAREPGVDLTKALGAEGPAAITAALVERPQRVGSGTVRKRLRATFVRRQGTTAR